MQEPYEVPPQSDDAENFSIIVAAGFVGMMATLWLIGRAFTASYAVVVPISEPVVQWAPLVEVAAIETDAIAGADRIYGRVMTTDGRELVGYLRWNGRETSWADVLPSTRPGSNVIAGVRFGHVAWLEPLDARTVRVTLKSGETVDLSVILSDHGTTPRPIEVEPDESGTVSVPWHDFASIELMPEPLDRAPAAERLYGTAMTRSGIGFTGYVSWDLDEALLSDGITGPTSSGSRTIPFSRISSVQPVGPEGARVGLTDGEQLVFGASADIGEANRGIVVADPLLGSVVVPWDRLTELRLRTPDTQAAYEDFDGGAGLFGVVTTTAGEEVVGEVRWDLDEASSWGLLDGQFEGIQYHVEFSQVTRLDKFRLGSAVTLGDGRRLYLIASNDVNWTNNGIEVRNADATRVVAWSDFSSFVVGKLR